MLRGIRKRTSGAASGVREATAGTLISGRLDGPTPQGATARLRSVARADESGASLFKPNGVAGDRPILNERG